MKWQKSANERRDNEETISRLPAKAHNFSRHACAILHLAVILFYTQTPSLCLKKTLYPVIIFVTAM